MISIITVVLNGEKTIRRTIDSVCNQTVLPLEYIIVDGHSSDSTLDIIAEYMQKYPFIKIISESAPGIYRAMNKGIVMARGHLVGIINSDDWYEKNAIEKMIESYTINGSGVHYGILRYILNEKDYFLERNSHEFLAKKMIPHPATFVSSDIYKRHGKFDTQYKTAADLDLFIRYLDQNVPFYKIDSIISNYRMGGASFSPKSAIESLTVRKKYGFVSIQYYYYHLLKLRLKSFF